MVNGPPPTSAGPSSYQTPLQQTTPQQTTSNHASANIYSFSVHQPYQNWPPPGAPYATAWYMHPHTYSHQQQQQQQQRTYCNEQTQTTPPPETEAPLHFRHHWDTTFRKFLKGAGLIQALNGFEDDMIVMSEEWERQFMPAAVNELMADLTALMKEGEVESLGHEKPFDERKLDYVHPANGAELQTPTAFTKSISRFIAQSRRRNDASNRAEFLQSITEKRRRLNGTDDSSADSSHLPMDPPLVAPSSCARTDARHLNRDVQMKYDIAKNEDGPLRRTTRVKTEDVQGDGTLLFDHRTRKRKATDDVLNGNPAGAVSTIDRHTGLAERFANLENHLAVRYVPSPPYNLLDRIRFLEDHLIQLEKNYPPWAAIHFNQPHRNWPQPPRTTPIIVPSHLTSHDETEKTFTAANAPTPFAQTSTNQHSAGSYASNRGGGSHGRGGRGGPPKIKSSLQRAVMEKLEVQRAIDDLARTQ